MRKRVLSWLLILILICSFVMPVGTGYAETDPGKGNEDDGNERNTGYTEAWYELLCDYDTDKDGLLSDEELAEVTRVTIPKWEKETLDGMERMVNLEVLIVESAPYLYYAYVDENKKLTELTILNSKLEYVHLGEVTELRVLNLEGELTLLDLSQNVNLEELTLKGYNSGHFPLMRNTDKLKKVVMTDCDVSELGSLESSKNLKELQLIRVPVRDINIAMLYSLEKLVLVSDGIEELWGLNSCNKLKYLEISEASFPMMHFMGFPELNTLILRNTEINNIIWGIPLTLEVLDISGNKKLQNNEGFGSLTVTKRLVTDGTTIENLDVSGFTELEYLSCRSSGLNALDVSRNQKLRYLDCADNGITELSLLNNRDLETLKCEQNKIESLDLSQNKKLSCLSCYANNFEELTISGASGAGDAGVEDPAYKEYYDESGENVLGSYDSYVFTDGHGTVTGRMETDCGLPVRQVYTEEELEAVSMFPDRRFRKHIMKLFDGNHDAVLDEEEKEGFSTLEQLSIDWMGIADLTGIERFTGLKYLSCFRNKLTELDVSANTDLFYLDCGENKIESLNLGINPNLMYLDCYVNNLSELDVSGTRGLVFLDCTANKLQELDISCNPYMKNACYSVREESEYMIPAPTEDDPDAEVRWPYIDYYNEDGDTEFEGKEIPNDLSVDFGVKIVTGEPNFSAVRMVLRSEIALQFVVNVPEGFTFETPDPFARIVLGNMNSRVLLSDAVKMDENNYIFTCPINPLQFADTVLIEFHWGVPEDEDGGELRDVFVHYETSAQEYCNMLPKTDEPLQALVKSIKEYAYAVSDSGWSDGQSHEPVDIGPLVLLESTVFMMQRTYREKLLDKGVEARINLENSGIKDILFSLSLIDKTVLNVYVLPEEGVTVSQYDGTREINGQTYYLIKNEPVGPVNLVWMRGMDVHTSVGTAQITACPMSYVYSFLNGNADLRKKLAMMKLYDYYESVVAYVISLH